MKCQIKKALHRNEFDVAVIIVLLCAFIEMRSGQFLSANNLVDMVSAMIVPTMFGIGQYMVIISGGFDVSFCTMASLSSYVIVDTLLKANYAGPIIVPILMAIVIGAVLGALNGFLIARYDLPAFIVTLGTQFVFRGLMQGALGAVQIYTVPPSMQSFGKAALFTVTGSSGLTSKMPVAVLFAAALVILAALVMRYTMFGRGIYAVGGSSSAAERAGFPVFWIKFFVYVISGAIASLTGLIRMSMIGQAQPTNLLGMELTIIASVVIGGTAIKGGKGTVLGALLGTLLIVLVQNSLIMIGIPTIWQSFFLGVLIIGSTGISAYQATHQKKAHKAKREVSAA